MPKEIVNYNETNLRSHPLCFMTQIHALAISAVFRRIVVFGEKPIDLLAGYYRYDWSLNQGVSNAVSGKFFSWSSRQ